MEASLHLVTLFLILLINLGSTLLEGVCTRLTWHLHNHGMTYVMNMKDVLFVTTVIKCHSLSYDILMQIW